VKWSTKAPTADDGSDVGLYAVGTRRVRGVTMSTVSVPN